MKTLEKFLPVIFGIVILILVFWVTSIFSSRLLHYKYSGAEQTQVVYFLMSILGTLRSLSPVLAGGIAGWLVREKGWLYGGYVGLIVGTVVIVLTVIAYYYPDPFYTTDYPKDILLNNVFASIVSGIKTTVFASLGGLAGESLQKSLAKKR
jgi:putative membrane protein (TIGR04086 family)